MAHKSLRRILILSLLGVSLYLAAHPIYRGYQNYAGICTAEGRILTEEELSSRAVNFLLTKYWVRDKKIEGDKHVLPYEGVQDFFERNPDCCNFLSTRPLDLPAPNSYEIFNGLTSRVMRVDYKLFYMGSDGISMNKVYQEIFFVTNCGAPYMRD